MLIAHRTTPTSHLITSDEHSFDEFEFLLRWYDRFRFYKESEPVRATSYNVTSWYAVSSSCGLPCGGCGRITRA